MKLAVMKLGARIHENDKIGNSTNEVLATIRLLSKGGADVTAFTKILKSDNRNTSFEIKSYEEFFDTYDEYDKLIIINGNANFFGGQYTHEVEVYKAINVFDKAIIYFMYDPYLGIKQIWKSVLSKPWGSNYSKNELEIKPNRLHYITQCRSVEMINEIGQKSCTYFPLELFPLIMENGNFTEVDFASVEFDLNYAGTYRGGRREDAMLKFFFGLPDDIRVQMFGNLKLDQFKKWNGISRPPMFAPPVTHDKVRENILKGLSTVIIGDPLYCELDDIAQRFAESIIFGQLTFIDSEYDRKSRAYKDKELESFLRINDQNELIDKLRAVKADKAMFYQLLAQQRSDLVSDFDPDAYCKNLVSLVGSLH